MTYIIEQANILKDDKVVKNSILIKNNQIEYMSSDLTRLNFVRMDLSKFLLTPGHVMMNFSLATHMPFQRYKEYISENYLRKGCTTLLVICSVLRVREIEDVVKRTKSYMLNSPIDFYIGLQIPLKLLTPTVIRICKRLNIPIVIVEIDDEKKLATMPWGWIKEAMYPYFFPIIPSWKLEKSFLRGKSHLQLWKKITTQNRIPSIHDCPIENKPLSKDILTRIGIYPDKGELRVRGEVDYNLYDLNEISYTVDEKPVVDYDNHIPSITVHKGKLLKIPSQVFFYPGFGKECKVKLPGHFMANS